MINLVMMKKYKAARGVNEKYIWPTRFLAIRKSILMYYYARKRVLI